MFDCFVKVLQNWQITKDKFRGVTMAISFKGLMNALSRQHKGDVWKQGRDGEFDTMLAKDMNLIEASRFHTKSIWKFDDREIFAHDAAHIILGLACNALPHEGLERHSYQGDYSAEIYNLEIEKILLGTITGRNQTLHNDKLEFVTGVLGHFRRNAPQENLNRTLGWLVSKRSGKDYDTIRSETAYDDGALQKLAESTGIQVEHDPSTHEWTVTLPNSRESFYYLPPDAHFMPGDLDGISDFAPFTRPHVKQIIEIYDRVCPAIQLLQEEAFKIDRNRFLGESFSDEAEVAMSRIKVRALYDAINLREISLNVATPSPENF